MLVFYRMIRSSAFFSSFSPSSLPLYWGFLQSRTRTRTHTKMYHRLARVNMLFNFFLNLLLLQYSPLVRPDTVPKSPTGRRMSHREINITAECVCMCEWLFMCWRWDRGYEYRSPGQFTLLLSAGIISSLWILSQVQMNMQILRRKGQINKSA